VEVTPGTAHLPIVRWVQGCGPEQS
jgi:hypothetical protein